MEYKAFYFKEVPKPIKILIPTNDYITKEDICRAERSLRDLEFAEEAKGNYTMISEIVNLKE